MKILQIISYLTCLITLFYSCTLITEPDRIFNHDASPPSYNNYNFEDFVQGQHVDGIVRMSFKPTDINSKIIGSKVFIDDEIIGGNIRIFPFTIDIHTRRYEEGSHTISIYVYTEDDNQGLLNLLDAPSRIYEITLYFDRTPPDTVTLSLNTEENNLIRLNWTESISQTFFSYLIYKGVNDQSFKLIDSISDRSITSYVDTVDNNLIGVNYQYKIAVTTDYKFEYQTDSNIEEGKIGDPFYYNFEKLEQGPFLNEQFGKVYFWVDKKLVSFSSLDNSLLHELDLTEFSGENYIEFSFNIDKTKIYLLNVNDQTLCVINSNNFSVIKYVDLPENVLLQGYGSKLFVLDESRVLIKAYKKLFIVDTDNSLLINSFEYPQFTHSISTLVLNKDNTRLILNYKFERNWYFDVFDVTNNNFDITKTVRTFEAQYISLKIGGDRLYCDAETIYDANSLNRITSIHVAGNIRTFAVSENSFGIFQESNYFVNNLYQIECRKLTLFDNQIQKIREWYLLCWWDFEISADKVFVGIDKYEPHDNDILGYSIKYGE
jgi:hypothetical protein